MKETQIKPTSRKAMQYRGVECLNCGHPLDLTDRYCAYCGQLNTTKRLTLKDFFSEFVMSVFTYDSRFRHTLKDLLFKPGTITRYYVDGKRFHYANPFRFFLSASIFYFIIISTMSFIKNDSADLQDANFKLFSTDDMPSAEDFNESIPDSIPEFKELPPEVGEEIQNVLDNAHFEIKQQQERKEKSKKIQDSLGISYDYISEKDVDTLSSINGFFRKFELFQKFYQETDIASSSKALDSLNYTKSQMNIWLYNKNDVIDRVEKDPFRFANYLASKTPFFLFFFSPFFAFFFWIIYSKKRANYMEHMVFIFHIFSWVFIVLLICLLPDSLLPTQNLFAALILTFIGPFYFYKALRNFYKQSRVITLIKFVFLNIVFWISTSIFAFIFFALTAAFY